LRDTHEYKIRPNILHFRLNHTNDKVITDAIYHKQAKH